MKTLCLLVLVLAGCGQRGNSSVSSSLGTQTKDVPAPIVHGDTKGKSATRVEHNAWRIKVRGYAVRPDGTYLPYDVVMHNDDTGEEYDIDPSWAQDFDGENYK